MKGADEAQGADKKHTQSATENVGTRPDGEHTGPTREPGEDADALHDADDVPFD